MKCRSRRKRLGSAVLLTALCACSVGDGSVDGERIEIAVGGAVTPWDGGQRLAKDTGVGDGETPPDAATVATAFAFRVTTLSQLGRYAPKNIGAIWIEDRTGAWVKTLAIWAGVRGRYLAKYRSANPTRNKVDAVTSATLREHTSHEVTWDLTDANGQRVLDGDYAVVVEVTDKDAAGHSTSVEFTVGSAPVVVRADDSEFFSGIELRL